MDFIIPIIPKTAALACLLLFFSHSLLSSEVEPKPELRPVAGGKAKEVSADEIRRLVGQLDANRFADRKAAGKRLEEIGQPAIEPLVAAAPRGSLELEQRAMQVLEQVLPLSG